MALDNIKDKLRSQFLTMSHRAKHNIDQILYQSLGRSLFYSSYSPPRLLESETAIQGISKDYVIPDNIDNWELERSFSLGDLNVDDFRKIVRDFIGLNPDLEPLSAYLDDERYPIDIAYGITSGFNPEDIRHFLDSANVPPAIKKRFIETRAYQNALGISLNWVPAPETLKKIACAMGKDENWGPNADDYKAAHGQWMESCRAFNAPEEIMNVENILD